MKKALLASLFLSFSIHAIASVSFQKIVDANADGDWKTFKAIPIKWKTKNCSKDDGFFLCGKVDIHKIGKGQILVDGSRSFTDNTTIFMEWDHENPQQFDDNRKYIQNLLPKYRVSELKVSCNAYGALNNRTAYLLQNDKINILLLVTNSSGNAGGSTDISLSKTDVTDKKAVYLCEDGEFEGQLVLPN